MKAISTLVVAALLSATPAQANNLTISPATVTNTGTSARITVNVQWEHSWRDAVNWDAAWLFVKYRPVGGQWRHATLATAEAAYQIPAGAALNPATDGKGVVLYRSALGSGTFSASGVALSWNTQADGVQPGQNYEVKVFGVEMVQIPQGSFNLNAAPIAGLNNEFISVGGSLSQITSEAALPAGAIRWQNESGGGGSGNGANIGGVNYEGSGALGANYPKGYAANYCMKYEISQGQYTDFLNSLTRPQQNRRVAANITADSPAGGSVYVMANTNTAATAFRNTITSPASGMGTSQPVQFSCARPDRSANYLIWADGAAYLDWAGLRPMSELEYEKACRGPEPAVAGEYAWGSTSLGRAATLSGPEDGTETTDATANIVYNVSGSTPYVPFVGGDGGDGPLRVGVFARANTTREQAGATYYGVMEMSGNCWERCVTVAGQDSGQPTNAGLFDLNNNGDGSLDANGEHNESTWPNATNVLGSNFRGGNWSRHREWAAVADRTYGGQAIADRTSHRSIRGVRSLSTLTPAVSVPAVGLGNPAKYTGGAYDGYATAAGVLALSTRLTCASCAGVTAAVLPNPVAGAATLRLSGRPALTDATLTIADALGRVVRRQDHLRGLEFDLSRTGLAPGVYVYKVSEHGELVVNPGRFVVE